jgi:hypothetical protein
MHGVDPLLLVLQGTHPSSPHFLKQQPVIVISRLLLLDVTNFITVQEVPSPSLNEKEETHVAIHIVSFICFLHFFIIKSYLFFVGTWSV